MNYLETKNSVRWPRKRLILPTVQPFGFITPRESRSNVSMRLFSYDLNPHTSLQRMVVSHWMVRVLVACRFNGAVSNRIPTFSEPFYSGRMFFRMGDHRFELL